jgi:hypothetical protein
MATRKETTTMTTYTPPPEPGRIDPQPDAVHLDGHHRACAIAMTRPDVQNQWPLAIIPTSEQTDGWWRRNGAHVVSDA